MIVYENSGWGPVMLTISMFLLSVSVVTVMAYTWFRKPLWFRAHVLVDRRMIILFFFVFSWMSIMSLFMATEVPRTFDLLDVVSGENANEYKGKIYAIEGGTAWVKIYTDKDSWVLSQNRIGCYHREGLDLSDIMNNVVYLKYAKDASCIVRFELLSQMEQQEQQD